MVKSQFPGEFVRVNVDAARLCLNVARRGEKDTEWTYLKDDIPLPKEVLNVSTRKVPTDLCFENLPAALSKYTPNKPERGRSGRVASNMEVASQDE